MRPDPGAQRVGWLPFPHVLHKDPVLRHLGCKMLLVDEVMNVRDRLYCQSPTRPARFAES
jgi:hypothetical protein